LDEYLKRLLLQPDSLIALAQLRCAKIELKFAKMNSGRHGNATAQWGVRFGVRKWHVAAKREV
jgi:hypothetical protein